MLTSAFNSAPQGLRLRPKKHRPGSASGGSDEEGGWSSENLSEPDDEQPVINMEGSARFQPSAQKSCHDDRSIYFLKVLEFWDNLQHVCLEKGDKFQFCKLQHELLVQLETRQGLSVCARRRTTTRTISAETRTANVSRTILMTLGDGWVDR